MNYDAKVELILVVRDILMSYLLCVLLNFIAKSLLRVCKMTHIYPDSVLKVLTLFMENKVF